MGKPEGYIDVAQRIVEFRDRFPDGCLRPANLERPYDVVTVDGKTFIVVVAAAYRTPDDPTPGVGMAWEPYPGPTNFTRDSELQNAETSAWGRALVAVLAADTKQGVASADEVRSRNAREPDIEHRKQLDLLDDLLDEAADVGADGDPEAAREYARKSPAHAVKAIQSVRDKIASAVGVEEASPDPEPEGAPADAAPVDIEPSWRTVAADMGVPPVAVVAALVKEWPKNDQAARPNNLKDVDRLAAKPEYRDLVRACIEDIAAERAAS